MAWRYWKAKCEKPLLAAFAETLSRNFIAKRGQTNNTLSVIIKQCTSVEQEGWLDLRQQLWPDCPREDHLSEMSAFCAQPERFAQFVVYAGSHRAVGFIAVAFLEGIYVVPEARRMGTARALAAAAERWAISRGCREFASDAALENETSHAMHRALGFQRPSA
jgi:aminoglycoside 6'-N-acetyltransferase I